MNAEHHPKEVPDGGTEPPAGPPRRRPARTLSLLERIQESVERVARLEELRPGYQESIIRRETRRCELEITGHEERAAAHQTTAARDGAALKAWVVDEAESMLRGGWTPDELRDLGFADDVLGEAAKRITPG
jgi:hypothetical protein